MDPDTGVIREPGHDLEGQSVAGKILVFPYGKGSTTGSWQFYVAFKRGAAPVGIINRQAEGVVAVSAIIHRRAHGSPAPAGPPGVHPHTGDMVRIDADQGLIEILESA